MLITQPGKHFELTKFYCKRFFASIKKTTNKGLPAKSRHTLKDLKSFKEFKRMLHFTLPVLFPNIPVEEVSAHTEYLTHLYQSKGPEYVVRYLKATHESIEKLILDLPGTLQHEKVSIGKDNSSWPKWLGTRLKSKCLVHEDPVYIRYVLTLCSTRRLIVVPTYTSLKSITEVPLADSDVVNHIVTSAEKDLQRYKKFFSRPEIGSWETENEDSVVTTHPTPGLQVNLKSGPNGVSMWSFPWDRAAISFHDLTDSLRDFADIYYSGEVDDWIEDKLDPYEELVDSNRQLNVGKVSLTFEGGKLKPRIFAMVDSLTQGLLQPFHKTLMSILRTINEDCTFDHAKVSTKAQKLHSEGHDFYGFADLSNASDAIDKRLYVGIGNLWLEDLGDSWVQLFDRDFIVPESVKAFWDTQAKFKPRVRYNTGQPMGALSSWPFMAIVHHAIVWSAFGSYKAAKGNYLLLGDDLVIFDRPAYINYCSLLDKLNIPYTNSFSTKGFEFAKRVFVNGKEITGAYTSALWASRNVPELFALEWRNLATRGYKSGNDLHPQLRTLLKVSRKRYEKCKLLMTIPYGTEIRVDDLAHFVLGLTGRSGCFLQVGNNERHVEAISCFRQGAAVLIKQRFQKLLDDAKVAIKDNALNFSAHFKKSSGLSDQSPTVMQTAINEYVNDSQARIRYLERDLKQSYLGSTKITKCPETGQEIILRIEPSNKTLLRPNLPQVPRLIDFSNRDKHVETLKIRAEHQLSIIEMLRG